MIRWQQALPIVGEGIPFAVDLALDIEHLSELNRFRGENRTGLLRSGAQMRTQPLARLAAGASRMLTSARVGAGRKPNCLVSKHLVSNRVVSNRLVSNRLVPNCPCKVYEPASYTYVFSCRNT